MFSQTDFIEACNLLQLKASITCERKLVFDKVPKRLFSAKATSTPVSTILVKPTESSSQQSNLDSLIADLEQEEHLEYQMKAEQGDESEQVIYEISNFEEAEVTYEDEEQDDMNEEPYELVNVVPESCTEVPESSTETADEKPQRKKSKLETSEIKPRTPPKPVDEETLGLAVREIISNSSR